ncbi:hypothetical protein JTE90_026136 [Oedothorax gibbosus]|uniref:Uncharacterized protein n=1 Tax=Oedothorax gibbosus TaxID=931172 RepID=A0AAV6UZJ5_9ARAC|nr:hypothetical protein JTE90_026136 [Oedothorax gibbosus]
MITAHHLICPHALARVIPLRHEVLHHYLTEGFVVAIGTLTPIIPIDRSNFSHVSHASGTTPATSLPVGCIMHGYYQPSKCTTPPQESVPDSINIPGSATASVSLSRPRLSGILISGSLIYRPDSPGIKSGDASPLQMSWWALSFPV